MNATTQKAGAAAPIQERALLDGTHIEQALSKAYPSPRAEVLEAEGLRNDTPIAMGGHSAVGGSVDGQSVAGGEPTQQERKAARREYLRVKQEEFRARNAEMLRERAMLRRAAHTLLLNIERGNVAPAELRSRVESADPLYVIELTARYFAGRLDFQKKK